MNIEISHAIDGDATDVTINWRRDELLKLAEICAYARDHLRKTRKETILPGGAYGQVDNTASLAGSFAEEINTAIEKIDQQRAAV